MYTAVLMLAEDWYAYGAEYVFPPIVVVDRAYLNNVFVSSEDLYYAYGPDYASAIIPDAVSVPTQNVWFDSVYYSYNNNLMPFIIDVVTSIISLKLNGSFVACEPVTKVKWGGIFHPIPRLKFKSNGEFK